MLHVPSGPFSSDRYSLYELLERLSYKIVRFSPFSHTQIAFSLLCLNALNTKQATKSERIKKVVPSICYEEGSDWISEGIAAWERKWKWDTPQQTALHLSGCCCSINELKSCLCSIFSDCFLLSDLFDGKREKGTFLRLDRFEKGSLLFQYTWH